MALVVALGGKRAQKGLSLARLLAAALVSVSGDGMGLRLAMALVPRAPNCCNVRFGMFFGAGRSLGQFIRVRIPAARTRAEGELMCSVRMTGIDQKPSWLGVCPRQL